MSDTLPASPVPSTPQIDQPLWLDLIHYWALFNLSITQSFYSRLVAQPEYLIAPEVTPDAVAGTGLLLTILIPCSLLGIAWLSVRHSPTRRDWLRSVAVLGFSSALLLQAIHSWPIPGAGTLLLGIGGGALATWLYQRFRPMRQVVTVMAIGIVLTPLILYQEFWQADTTAAYQLHREETRPRVPVVLIVFDEFSGPSLMTPDQRIDEERFPHLAQLSKTANWYRNACCVAPLTTQALPAILTGRLPPHDLTATPKVYPQNLFQTLIAGAGYEYVAFEPVSVIAPQDAKTPSPSVRQSVERTGQILRTLSTVHLANVLPSDFQAYLPEVPKVWFGFNQKNPIDRAARRGRLRYGWTTDRDEQIEHFLDCIDQTPEGVLYFGHFLLPHAPYCVFPDGQRYAPDSFDMNVGCLADGSALEDDLGLIQSQQRYLMQLMYLDQVVGKIVKRMKAQGIYDNALLIVTADHGVSFRLKSHRREFSEGNTADIARIPLLVKFPHQQVGARSDAIVQSTDILPTILETIGGHPSLPMDGLSLRDPRTAERQTATAFNHNSLMELSRSELTATDLPQQILLRFGRTDDRWNLFRIGPHAEWLGASLTEFSINEQSTGDVQCLYPEDHSDDIAHQEYFLEGTILGPVSPKPVELVISVNETICATTRTYKQFGFQDRWSAMLPPWSYSNGPGAPQIYTVGPERTLSPLRIQWLVKPSPPTDFS